MDIPRPFLLVVIKSIVKHKNQSIVEIRSKSQMGTHAKRFLLILLLILPTFRNSQAKELSIEKAKKNLIEINKNLESLEFELNNSHSHKICLITSDSALLITEENDGLKILEPNYDWVEIKQVLLEISSKHCSPSIEK